MKSTFRILVVIATFAVGFVRLASAADMPMKSELLSAYAKIADALASDDLGGATAAAGALAEHAGMAGQKQMAEQAARISKASNISAAREQFKALSLSIEPLAAGVEAYTVMTCAMAKADWVQTAGDVRNPYYGKSMLSCGEAKKVDGPSGHGCGEAAPNQDHSAHGKHGCG